MRLINSLFLMASLAVPAFALPEKPWTVLVYMAADNDLEEAALDDLAEMLDVGSSENLNIVVQADRADGYTDAGVGGLKNWTGTKRLVVEKGRLTAVATLGPTDTGDPRVLRDFVAWGLKTYPARRTALVFWDHGGGRAGFGSDEGSGTTLDLQALGRGLADGLKASGGRFDLVGFDACLMATLETARILAPSARYLLASEELEPGFGWDWRALRLVSTAPETGAPALGSALIAGYEAFCRANGEGAQYTLSLTDLDKVAPIEAALKTLDGAAVPRLKTLGGDFGRARFQSVEFGKSGDPAEDTHMVDLGDLARQWQQVPALAAGAQALAAAVKAAVVDRRGGSVQKAATGLSLWFPSERQYYDPDYARYGPPSWVHLLESYYAAGAALPAGEQASAEVEEPTDPGLSVDEGWVTFTRPFDKKVLKNVTQALLYYGTVDPKGQARILGSRQAAIDLAAGQVTGEWDLSALTLVQGKVQVPVFLSEDQADDHLMAFSVPFSYFPDGNLKKQKSKQPVWLSVTIDLDKNEITEETFYQETENDLVGEFQPDPGSRIVPRVFERTKDGWEFFDRGSALDPSQPLDYEFRDVPLKGDFYLSLDVSDYGANDGSQEYEGPLP